MGLGFMFDGLAMKVCRWPLRLVMAGLDPAIQITFPAAMRPRRAEDQDRIPDAKWHCRLDGRVKPGHDGEGSASR
jgi:hypothetical protein